MRWLFDNIIGGIVRFFVGYVLTNWVPIMSAVAAFAAAALALIKKYDYLQIAITASGVFLIVMWTCISFIWIRRLDEPLRVIQVVNYDYALAYQGLTLGLDVGNDESCLQIGINFLNVGPMAIKYKITDFRVVIGDRTIPHPMYDNQGGVIPRAVGRIYRYPAFRKAAIKDYLGTRQCVSACKIDPLGSGLLGCLLWFEAGGGGC
jgi:hypothetical protein